MINELNVYIFNYIFSLNEDIKKCLKEDCDEYKNVLNQMICNEYILKDFWDEYKDCFNTNCIKICEDLDSITILYNNFPRMTIDTKKRFLDYKAREVKKIIENNGDIIKEELEEVFVNIENLGQKVILDYCKDNEIIMYNGNPFFSASGNPAYAIIYDNIHPVIKKEEEKLIIPTTIQNINYGNNYGTIEQNINFKDNNEELFEIVLEKLKAIQIESNIADEKIEKMKIACEKKDKKILINFLKEIAMGTGTNLIASGILKIFGLM